MLKLLALSAFFLLLSPLLSYAAIEESSEDSLQTYELTCWQSGKQIFSETGDGTLIFGMPFIREYAAHIEMGKSMVKRLIIRDDTACFITIAEN